jgi:RNA polymerase sigma-70 factor (ECF subfamily)
MEEAMANGDPETQVLLEQVRGGDADAMQRLLGRHRDRLLRMVNVRMDPRLNPRIDASDVVQEALLEATRKLPSYLERGGCAFYPWLRRIAWERLAQLHRHHIGAQRRSVKREARHAVALSDRSTMLLARQLAASATSVGGRLVRQEACRRVRQALEELPEREREAVVLRHLEQLSLGETAAVLDISTEAARSRYRRAIERLHDVLSEDSGACQ